MTRKKSVRESPDEQSDSPLSVHASALSGKRKSLRETDESAISPLTTSGKRVRMKLDDELIDEPPPSTQPDPNVHGVAAAAVHPGATSANHQQPASQRTTRKPPPPPLDLDLDTTTSHLRRRFDLAATLEARNQKPSSSSSSSHGLPPQPQSKPPVITTKPLGIPEVRDVNKEARRLIARSESVPTPRPRLPMSCIPRKAMARRELLRLPLDHRGGFILSLADGETTIRTIIDVSGMPESEVCSVLERLIALRVIVLS